MKTPGRFFSGKHEISSVYMLFYTCICACEGVHTDLVVFGDGQEEQHANTSANYDVELLHHRDAHLEFFKNGGWGECKSLGRPSGGVNNDVFLSWAGDLHMAGTSTRENGLKETVTLKWCTPRSNNIGGLTLAWMLVGSREIRKSQLRDIYLLCCFRVALLHWSISHLPHRRKQSPFIVSDKLSPQW